ncbi:uncharacterized protein PGRI_001040 [Penicillium griseofulvum]|uniref:Uncharacterized protein n=1 Tax=Penicillium patulum TaxID=5078 RepID=A0A135LVQ4_PENPA|nr:uncharacterized protein PGRI_001040 [Penicillium griseofulvum]KXG53054.1 hypothetical protein PGRI_001040 [Penicillium griseofulvum]
MDEHVSKPKWVSSLSDENVETEKEPLSKPEEPIDEDLDEPDEDLDEPDEVANAEEDEIEDEEPITESAAAWLGRPPKEQNALRKLARAARLHHLGLKCIGPGRVVEGLVLGAQVCPSSTIISFETGVFYKDGPTNHVGLRSRCVPCNGRFKFNEFLGSFSLKAADGDTACGHGSSERVENSARSSVLQAMAPDDRIDGKHHQGIGQSDPGFQVD